MNCAGFPPCSACIHPDQSGRREHPWRRQLTMSVRSDMTHERNSNGHTAGAPGARRIGGFKAMLLGAAALGGAVGVVGLNAYAPSASAQAPRLLSPQSAAQGQVSIPDLVERVSPAVVSILVEREVERPTGFDPFQEFFQFRFGDPFEGGRGGPGDNNEAPTQRMSAQGSGFFVDGDGHIVTNNHVVEEADAIRVRLANGDELDATLVGTDPLTDLAVVKVEPPRGQRFVEFADDVNLRVGETVVAVGNPFGLGGTVTSGIVSAIGGENRQGQFLDYIQIDAPINRGNSGGPTFDLQGRVVGVNTAIYSPNGGSVGIGFAIPARVARGTVDQLIDNGSVTRGWLGVSLRELDSTFAAAIGRQNTEGAFVEDVLEGTPAAKSGVKAGDLILSINGEKVADTIDLSRKISSYAPGETVKVVLVRDRRERTIDVTLGARGADDDASPVEGAGDSPGEGDMSQSLGVRVEELSRRSRDLFRIPDDVDGVVISAVRRGGAAAEAGLREGMVILEVDGAAVTTSAALESRVEAARKEGKDAVLLRLQVGSQKRFAALPIGADG
ncbi:MAG: Do family serine endopeptidase [Alphaproteobacteria bacterium]|nr:Do family serine endopeptidase [Alphaproteobacteria bacterium]